LLLGEENIGVLLFKNIFEAAPDAMKLFTGFSAIAADPNKDLYESDELKAHGLKVIGAVTAAVGLLDDTEKLVPIL